MKELGKRGVWIFPDAPSAREVAAFAQAAEGLGYDALWYPEGTGFESLSFAAFVLAETERLCAASGIANIYARDAVAAIAGHDTLNHFYGDRFVLGLGVSHVPLVEGFRGHTYAKPVATMRAYLDAMDAAEVAIPAQERNVVLAALGPRMLALAAERTRGAHPYNVTPEHTARAREIVGPGRLALRRAEGLRHQRGVDGAQRRSADALDLHAAHELLQQLAQPRLRRGRAGRAWQRPLPRRHGGLGQARDGARADQGAFRRRREPRLHPAARPGRQHGAGPERDRGSRRALKVRQQRRNAPRRGGTGRH